MRIIFLGDSITEGVGASRPINNYVCKVAEICEGVMTENFGVSGTRIARQTTPTEFRTFDYDFQMRCEVMSKDADKVFVFGGTNDYGHGDAPFGKQSDDTDDTFCGALNNLLGYLTRKYPKNKICFVLPTFRCGEENPGGECGKANGKPLSEYRKQIVRSCKKFGVDCLDICDVFPEPMTKAGDEYTVDGLHPNDLGHNRIAEKLYKYLLEYNKLT